MSETGKEYGEFLEERRSDNYTRFRKELLPRLKNSQEVLSIEEQNYSFILTTKKWGVVDIFPKANKVRVRRLNRWTNGVQGWAQRNLL